MKSTPFECPKCKYHLFKIYPSPYIDLEADENKEFDVYVANIRCAKCGKVIHPYR